MYNLLELPTTEVECRCVEFPTCGKKMPEEDGGFRCSLMQEHLGDHMACGETHNIATWKVGEI